MYLSTVNLKNFEKNKLFELFLKNRQLNLLDRCISLRDT